MYLEIFLSFPHNTGYVESFHISLSPSKPPSPLAWITTAVFSPTFPLLSLTSYILLSSHQPACSFNSRKSDGVVSQSKPHPPMAHSVGKKKKKKILVTPSLTPLISSPVILPTAHSAPDTRAFLLFCQH